MIPNPTLRRIGLSNADRAVILHVDDVGMCGASVDAFAELWEAGAVSSGSVMVPCPWFPSAAAWARQHPEADLGVHATLNSEWAGFRWGPVSTADPATGLIDAWGYFHDDQLPVWEGADEAAVWREVEAQIARAAAAGIDITHVDTHMLTLSHPRFTPGYIALLRRHRLPGLLPTPYAAYLAAFGFEPDPATAAALQAPLDELEAEGFPLIDVVDYLPLEFEGDQVELVKAKLDALQPGTITHLLMHPAHDTPELRAMAPDWRARVGNFEAFMSREVRAYLRDSGVQVIGYRPLRELLCA